MPKLPARCLPVLLLAPAAMLVSACMSKPAPQAPPAAEESRYPQQAGYAQPPAPVATATGAPGQYPSAPVPGQYPGMSPTATLPNFAEPPAADVPGALAQLDRYEQALVAVLGLPGGDNAKAGAMKQAPPPPSVTLAQGDACSIACIALASMRRSAEHVCGMAGEKDPACSDARDRVQRAQARVTAACPTCAAK